MKRLLLLLGICAIATAALADETTRQTQSELKKQGFYFGEVDGSAGPEFSASLKRYQIRNGLEVTGQLNAETSRALGLATAPAPPAPPPVAQRSTPIPVRPEVRESDRQALRETKPTNRIPRDRSVVPPPADYEQGPAPQGDYRYRELYQATPYANAPRGLQEQTLRAAQNYLTRRSYYRGAPDGLPGPETEAALIDYQRGVGLRPTGRLDLDTLDSMRLLPGPESENPVLTPFKAPGQPYERRVYRGIWVR